VTIGAAPGGTSPDAVALIPLGRPVDVVPTVAPHRVGRGDPTFVLGSAGLWRGVRTPDGPAALRLRPADGGLWRAERPAGRGTDEVRAEAWGPGSAAVLAAVPAWLGRDDPGARAVPVTAATHPAVARAVHRHAAVRMGRDTGAVAALVRIILEQRVTTVEAHRSYRALARVFGAPAPGPLGAEGLRLGPDPARLAALAYHDLHRFGIERRRADTIRRVCRRAVSLDTLAAAGDVSAPLLRATVAAIPGVGPWSQALLAQLVLGDPDAVVVGDLHLPHLVTWRLAGEPRGDDARMLDLLAPYTGQRGRVVRLLGLDGPAAPRRGPRQRLQPIASR
jgi:3-methyladenine DNA glycosylase/8-oxoguanine DNA glycosylase